MAPGADLLGVVRGGGGASKAAVEAARRAQQRHDVGGIVGEQRRNPRARQVQRRGAVQLAVPAVQTFRC